MKKLMTISALTVALATAAPVFAGPPPPPPVAPDWYNTLILVDVSGSMAGIHATSPTTVTKLDQARIQAKDHVLQMVTKAAGKTANFALWTFDSSYPAPNFVTKVVDFTSYTSATGILAKLGFDSFGNPSGSPDPAFVPSNGTPLAAAACYVVDQLAASLDINGLLPAGSSGGFQWNSMLPSGDLANIERNIFIESDGLENSTPTGECSGRTSTLSDYTAYESDTWQYKVRNKLQSGCADNPNVNAFPGAITLIVNVDLVFTNFISGLTSSQESRVYSGGGFSSYSTEPTLAQAQTLYGGVAKATKGKFKMVTVAANGTAVIRRPGDVNSSGCVDNTDYTLLMASYGQQCNANRPACYASDLNGDNYVNYSDYLILLNNWGQC